MRMNIFEQAVNIQISHYYQDLPRKICANLKNLTMKGNQINLRSIKLLLMFCLFISCHEKKDFLSGPSAYLGQKPPGDVPEIFAKGMLVDSGIVLGRVSFSKDGSEFYYTYARHWFDNQGTGTKEIRFDGTRWQKPVTIGENVVNPAISPDGQTIYLGGPGGQVWVTRRSDTGWSVPEVWLEKEYGLYNFQPTLSNNFYTGSNAHSGHKNDFSTYDFCRFQIFGKDTIISSLGPTINTAAFDGDFFIAPDESYMIISAKETKTYECELWISFQTNEGKWSQPQSLGPAINDGLAHRFGEYVSPDGKYLFYTKGTSEEDCHFYWVRFDGLLKKLKERIQ
jgi:WD40-like Beta Propeller Repeat